MGKGKEKLPLSDLSSNEDDRPREVELETFIPTAEFLLAPFFDKNRADFTVQDIEFRIKEIQALKVQISPLLSLYIEEEQVCMRIFQINQKIDTVLERHCFNQVQKFDHFSPNLSVSSSFSLRKPSSLRRNSLDRSKRRFYRRQSDLQRSFTSDVKIQAHSSESNSDTQQSQKCSQQELIFKDHSKVSSHSTTNWLKEVHIEPEYELDVQDDIPTEEEHPLLKTSKDEFFYLVPIYPLKDHSNQLNTSEVQEYLHNNNERIVVIEEEEAENSNEEGQLLDVDSEGKPLTEGNSYEVFLLVNEEELDKEEAKRSFVEAEIQELEDTKDDSDSDGLRMNYDNQAENELTSGEWLIMGMIEKDLQDLEDQLLLDSIQSPPSPSSKNNKTENLGPVYLQAAGSHQHYLRHQQEACSPASEFLELEEIEPEPRDEETQIHQTLQNANASSSSSSSSSTSPVSSQSKAMHYEFPLIPEYPLETYHFYPQGEINSVTSTITSYDYLEYMVNLIAPEDHWSIPAFIDNNPCVYYYEVQLIDANLVTPSNFGVGVCIMPASNPESSSSSSSSSKPALTYVCGWNAAEESYFTEMSKEQLAPCNNRIVWRSNDVIGVGLVTYPVPQVFLTVNGKFKQFHDKIPPGILEPTNKGSDQQQSSSSSVFNSMTNCPDCGKDGLNFLTMSKVSPLISCLPMYSKPNKSIDPSGTSSSSSTSSGVANAPINTGASTSNIRDEIDSSSEEEDLPTVRYGKLSFSLDHNFDMANNSEASSSNTSTTSSSTTNTFCTFHQLLRDGLSSTGLDAFTNMDDLEFTNLLNSATANLYNNLKSSSGSGSSCRSRKGTVRLWPVLVIDCRMMVAVNTRGGAPRPSLSRAPHRMMDFCNRPFLFHLPGQFNTRAVGDFTTVCRICYEDNIFWSDSLSLRGCGHTYCKTCLTHYLEGRINDGNVLKVPCPDPNCPNEIHDLDARKLLNPTLFDRYQKFRHQALLRVNPNSRWCPSISCAADFVAGEDTLGYPDIVCPECGLKFCVHCNLPSHSGLSCSQARHNQKKEISRKRRLEEKKTERYLKTHKAIRCKKCKALIEKLSGCNHMRCVCGYDFCWLCGETIIGGGAYPIHYQTGACAGLQFSQHELSRKRKIIRKVITPARYSLMVPALPIYGAVCLVRKMRNN